MDLRFFALLVSPLLASAPATAQEPAVAEAAQADEVRREEVVVVSASKIESTLVNAPATVSVVTGGTIASSPAHNYGDLLRSVPGLNVIQLSARDINLTSRQATSTLANSQLALLDGRSIYLDFFGLVLWDFVPTSAAEIKQIEVVRGPASAVWGANALTGVVNIITKSPRDQVGTEVSLTGGSFNRDGGSREAAGSGEAYGGSFRISRAPSERFAWKLSAGYFDSDPFSRPVGRVPVGHHPLDPNLPTGGAAYPVDGPGPPGTAYENSGTSQPKVDARLDQELAGGDRLTYAAGWAGTQGIVHTGLGPFDIQSGSSMAYAKANYSKGALKLNAFANFVNADAPNLLLPDPATLRPLVLEFSSQTYDVEVGHSTVVGARHILSYGGNARRNNFDITLAPSAKDRNEFGAYFQDEIYLSRFRFVLGGRVDKFGNIDKAVFSPRVTGMFKPTPEQSLRISFNRAFRSPSVINNYLDQSIFAPTPVDLRALLPIARLLAPELVPALSAPISLVVRNVGNRGLKEESLNAYEAAYTGTFKDRTTVGIAVYQNDGNDSINFARLLPSPENPSGLPGFDVYMPSNAPDPIGINTDGIPVPGALVGFLAGLPGAFGGSIVLPRTVSEYLNLSGLRQRGLEVSIDHAVSSRVTLSANYSFQATPKKLTPEGGQIPLPTGEIGVSARNRFNASVTLNTRRFVGSASLNHSDRAFWTDVLTPEFDGYSNGYTMVNVSLAARWSDGKLTTSLKGTNVFNQTIQQHTIGDIIKRSVFFEVRLSLP